MEMNEEMSLLDSKEPRKKALIIDPKIILNPLSELVHSKLKKSQSEVLEFYKKYKNLDDQQTLNALEKKKWYSMLYSEKDMKNLISTFWIYLTFSDALVVPEHILNVLKNYPQNESENVDLKPLFSNESVWSFEEKLAHQRQFQQAQSQLDIQIEEEKELLKELKMLELELQQTQQKLILYKQKKKFEELEKNKLKIFKLLHAPEIFIPLKDVQDIKEKLNRLSNDCENLEFQADRLIEYPAINYWEEDHNSVNHKSYHASSAPRINTFLPNSPEMQKFIQSQSIAKRPSENFYMNGLDPLRSSQMLTGNQGERNNENNKLDMNGRLINNEDKINENGISQHNIFENDEDIDFLEGCLKNLA